MTHFLQGKTIKSIKIADDKMALLFVCCDGEHVARVDAECCSHSWIENIDVRVLSFPATVLSVDDIDIPENGHLVAFYGLSIKTDRGEIELDYRNESTGYYGGSISWPGEYFYGGVFEQNVSSQKWEDVPR